MSTSFSARKNPLDALQQNGGRIGCSKGLFNQYWSNLSIWSECNSCLYYTEFWVCFIFFILSFKSRILSVSWHHKSSASQNMQGPHQDWAVKKSSAKEASSLSEMTSWILLPAFTSGISPAENCWHVLMLESFFLVLWSVWFKGFLGINIAVFASDLFRNTPVSTW